MARPERPERNRAARSFGQLKRFHHGINSDKVFGTHTRITVFGVGGAGGNAVNNMIAAGLQGVDFIVANTDAQALTMSKAERLIQMGTRVTEGLGAGSHPEVGRAAAEETIDAIRDSLTGAHIA